MALEHIDDGCPWTLFLYFESGLSNMVVDITVPWGTYQVEDISEIPNLAELLENNRGSARELVDLEKVAQAVGRTLEQARVSKTPTFTCLRFLE